MAWTAQWRTKRELTDAIFVLDDNNAVREVVPASQPVLSRFLTDMGDLKGWKSEAPVEGDSSSAEAWGQLVAARAATGEVLEVEPELLWHGIYLWFRSQGVDYDTPGLDGTPGPRVVPKLQRSSLMDD
jgi:hypothetical protein